ncbi:MAG: response regulator [Nitrospinales bacterium]
MNYKMKKILVVDDQTVVRELVTETLSASNYQISECDNAEQAVEYAKAEKPDLILMDIMMPGRMDGLEATRIIKSDPSTQKCTIIFLTAKMLPDDIKEAYRAGGSYYFLKPFSPMKLVAKIEKVLGQTC